MPKMRLKPDQLQTSCLASGVAVHPKANRGKSHEQAPSRDLVDLGLFHASATHLP